MRWPLGYFLRLMIRTPAFLAIIGFFLSLADPSNAWINQPAPAATASNPLDWPCWRGPNFDGVCRETAWLKSWPEKGPPVLWKVPLAGGYSSFAVAHGRLYTQTCQNKKQEIVLCLDAGTGQELWRFIYDCDYDRYVTLGERYDTGPRATPAVDGDRVYTIGTTGLVHCLNAETGRLIWQHDLLKIGNCKCPHHGYCSSPLIVGDLLIVHPGGSAGKSLAAINKTDGTIIWQALDDPISYSSPIRVDWDGVPQVVFFTGTSAVGVAPKDGKLLWRHAFEEIEHQVHCATPIHSNGQVFISSNFTSRGSLLQLKKESNPDLVWQTSDMRNHFLNSVLYEGYLYGFTGPRLRCVDLRTGKMVWEKTGIGRGSILVADGHLLILCDRGELILAEASPARYQEKARCKPLQGPALTVPVLVGGRLYLRDEKTLVALDVREKKP
jgi:outer membrane protein assembly factor BamB